MNKEFYQWIVDCWLGGYGLSEMLASLQNSNHSYEAQRATAEVYALLNESLAINCEELELEGRRGF